MPHTQTMRDSTRDVIARGNDLLSEIDSVLVQSGDMRLQISRDRCSQAVDRLFSHPRMTPEEQANEDLLLDLMDYSDVVPAHTNNCECSSDDSEFDDDKGLLGWLSGPWATSADGSEWARVHYLNSHGAVPETPNNVEVAEWEESQGIAQSMHVQFMLNNYRAEQKRRERITRWEAYAAMRAGDVS